MDEYIPKYEEGIEVKQAEGMPGYIPTYEEGIPVSSVREAGAASFRSPAVRRDLVRRSFAENDPLLLIEDDADRRYIEHICAGDVDGGEARKKRIGLANYYSMHHPEAAGFIYQNIEGAIKRYEGKEMSVEQAYASVAEMFQPKDFQMNRYAAAAASGSVGAAKAAFNAITFLSKNLAGFLSGWFEKGFDLKYSGEDALEEDEKIFSGEGARQAIDEYWQPYRKALSDTENFYAEQMRMPEGGWVTFKDGLADFVENGTVALVNYMPQLAGQLAMTMASGSVAPLAFVYGADAYYDIKEDDLPGDVSEGKALLYGLGVGLINGALEKVTLDVATGKVTEKFTKEGLKKGLKNAFKYLAITGGKEGAEEGIEEFVENILDIGFGRRGDTHDWTAGRWMKELFQGAPEAALIGAVTGFGIGAMPMGAMKQLYVQNERARQVIESRIDELNRKENLTPEEEADLYWLKLLGDADPEDVRKAAFILMYQEMTRPKTETAATKKAGLQDGVQDGPAPQTGVENGGLQEQSQDVGTNETQVSEAAEEGEAEASAESGTIQVSEAAEEGEAEASARAERELKLRRDLPHNPADTAAEIEKWKKLFPNVNIEITDAWTPEQIRILRQRGVLAPEKAQGLFDLKTNTVILNISNLRPSEVPFKILHEVGLHAGIRQAFGDEAANRLFLAVFDAMQDSPFMQRVIDAYKLRTPMLDENGEAIYNPDGTPLFDDMTDAQKAEAAEEFLAFAAETYGVPIDEIYADNRAEIDRWGREHGRDTHDWNEKRRMTREWMSETGFKPERPGWWKQLISQIRVWLAEHGFGHLREADIETIIQDAFKGANRANRANRTNEEARFALGGEIGAGRLSDSELKERNRQTAIEMEEAGKAQKDIWLATGWERDKDGKWRFELPDMKVKLNILNTEELNEKQGWYLWDFADGRELFDAYPELKDVIVRIEDLPPLTNGHYDPNSNEIVLNRNGLIESSMTVLKWREEDVASSNAENMPETNAALSAIRKDLANTINDTLVHEVQHAIQEIEGFAKGTNISEARNVNHEADDPVYSFKEQYGEKIDRGFVRLAEISKDDLKLNKEEKKELVDSVFDLIMNAKTDLSLLDDFKSMVERYAPNADEATKTKFLDIAQSIRIANEYHDRYLKAMSADQTYRRFAGETESRNIQLRARMSDEERRNRPPSFTEDVHRAYQIVRFSLAEDISPEQEKEIRDAYDYAMNGEPAAQLTGNEFQKDGVPLTQKVTKFYQDEYGGKVVHPELGEVKLDLEGVKSSLGHGIGRAKSAAYAAVPQLIEKGKIFERQTNWKGRGYDTVVMAAPLEIGGVPYIGEVVVEKRSNRQGFYLHEVEVKEKLADAFKTSTKGGASPVSRLIISQLIEKVKAQSEKKAEKAANFKRWFKDSKVVDEDGKPLVVYHGTDADFNVFDMDKTRANMDIRGAFFSPWEDDAKGYGKNVRAFYLSIQNPATGDQAYKALNMFKGQNNAGVKARDYLIQQGYDGVINENEEYIAFYPEQIKSATENVGTFDPNNPDVRYSLDNMSEEDKFDLVKLLKPKWDEAAFVEPSEAKVYLESIGETAINENEAWSLYQMAGAAIRAENKRAKERARDKWIEQNYDLLAKVSEFASSRGLLDFVIRPSFRFKDNDEWPGTFIAKEWRERGKLKPQGKMSDARYLKYKNDRDRALEHADGKASDELAQEIANKYGGDPLDIEEQIISTFRYLKKTDLYRAYSKFISEQNYRNKQENAIAEEEYAEFKRAQIEQTVAGILENGNQITEEWAMANPEVFAELYRTLMNGEEPPKSKRPSRENLEAMNAKLANEDINAVTYKAAKRAAFAEYQKRLTALRQEMNDKNANAARLQRNAAAFAEEHLPEELRGKFIRGIIKLLDYGTSPSKVYPEGKRMAEFYKLQSEMLNAAQSKRTQDSIVHINEMLDAVKMKRNWKGIPVSVIPSEQTRVERIRTIVNMSAASVANAIDYNNERILELEDRSDKYFEGGETNEKIVAEIQKLKDDNALLELFGNLEYRKPDSATKAEEFLESLIRGGKAKFKSLLAEQAGRVLEMRQQAVNEITGGRNVIPRHGTDAKNHTPYMTKNMNLPTLLRLIAARSGLDFDSSVFGKLLRNVEDSTQKEATANRRLQEEFDAELEAECGITGNIQEKLRKKGRFFKDAGKVVEHTGVYKTQYSRLKVIDPFDNPIVQEDRSSSKVHLIPVEDYEYKGETKPGVRSILRTIDNGGSVEFDGVPLDETGIWMLRKQLDDYDAGIDRRLEFFVDEIDKESAEKLKGDSEKDKLAVISRGTNAEEKRVEVPLSQGTALQILLTWEQEDFRPNMKWNGWTEESIEQIKKFLKPETLKLGYWMRDYFAKQRGELDAAAVKRYGAHLPENANYWPGRFSGRGGTIGTGGMRGVGTMSINPSFLIARKFHLNPVDIDVDAFSVFMDGQAQQNHFLAWTDTIRDLREVIGNADVQDAINGYFGTEVTRNLAERIVTIAQNGTQRGFLVSFFNPMMRHFIPAKIAMNIGSIAKQVEGVLAYINRMPTGEFFKYMSRANFGNPDYRAFAEMAVKSDYLKNRMAGGLDRDILYLMQYTRDVAHYSPFGDSLVSATTYLNKRADRWSTLHGGFAVYQYTLDQARKSGLDEKTAQERARRAWMRATDETQQSGYLKDLNYFQQNQGLVRYLTAFMSNPIQVMNLELQTLNEIKYIPDNAEAKRKLARQILVNHIVVPTLMRFTTDMMRYGINLSDWWDEAEFEDYLQAWLLGPFEGLFLFGKVAGVAWDLAEYVFFGRRGKNLSNADVNALPLLGETRQNAMRFRKDVLDGELTEKDIEDGLAFAGDIGMLYGATPLPGAAEAGSAGVVANASGTLLKRILRMFSGGDDDKKKSRK